MKYNPSFLSEQELIDTFVVRHADLEIIIEIIRENVTNSNQHVLVIGPRGSGKTTLVHRVAAEVEQTAELRDRWYPLIFSEESYEVVSAGEFWLEALFHLSEQEDNGSLKRTHSELKKESDDQRLAERALAQLLDFADQQGKRILMIVENLNMLFSDLNSDEEVWKIRHTLINEPRLMLLATATNRFEHIENASQAMFEMFKIQELKALDDDECNCIWEMITGKRLEGERIKPVRILTGGNPRLITIIAKFSAHRSFRQLLDDLVDLIDDHTEYFKSHLDNLPAIERKAYLALAGLWDASTAREIAQEARMDVNKTSSLLNRLVTRGAVVAETHGKKTKWYVVAERMYNIYYLMRRRGKPADRVKATVKFLVNMYDPESAAKLITEEACRLSPELRRDHCLAYEATISEVHDRNLRERIISTTPKNFFDSPYFNGGFRDSLLVKEEEFRHSTEEIRLLNEANALVKKGITLSKLNCFEEAIAVFDEVVARFADSDETALRALAAIALLSKGIALGEELNRIEGAITVFDEVVVRFADSDETVFRKLVAMALVIQGNCLSELNRVGEAITVFDEVVARFADSDETALREQAARALVNKGRALDELNRAEEAIAVFDEVVARFADSDETALREQVASALINKGYRLGELNRTEEAIAVYDQVVALFAKADAVALREQAARVLVTKGITLGKVDRAEEAIAVFDEVVARFADAEETALREQVAKAQVNKGKCLAKLDRSEEEIVIYDQVVVRFADSDKKVLREMAAISLVRKGIILGELNRAEEGIAVLDEVVARFSGTNETIFHELVAIALSYKGYHLVELNRAEEAIAVFDEEVARFAGAEEAALREQVASALINKGVTLGELNRAEEAIAVFDEVVARFADAEETALREQVAEALSHKGSAFDKLNKYEEAENALRKAIELSPDAHDNTINLIKLLLKMPGQLEVAIQTAEEIIDKNSEDSKLLNKISWAFYSHKDPALLSKTETWARKAAFLSPDDAIVHHTLACTLSALGKGNEALESAQRYIQDTSLVENTIEDAIELFVELAASGQAEQALAILIGSDAEKHLEPLVAGLKLYLGEDVKTAPEIREIAKDVVKRIESRLKKRRNSE